MFKSWGLVGAMLFRLKGTSPVFPTASGVYLRMAVSTVSAFSQINPGFLLDLFPYSGSRFISIIRLFIPSFHMTYNKRLLNY